MKSGSELANHIQEAAGALDHCFLQHVLASKLSRFFKNYLVSLVQNVLAAEIFDRCQDDLWERQDKLLQFLMIYESNGTGGLRSIDMDCASLVHHNTTLPMGKQTVQIPLISHSVANPLD